MLCVSDFQRIAISNNSIHTQSEEVIPVFRKGEFSVNLQIIIVKQNRKSFLEKSISIEWYCSLNRSLNRLMNCARIRQPIGLFKYLSS